MARDLIDAGSISVTAPGWLEWATLPALGVAALQAKIDTGAKASSQHAENLEVIDVARPIVARGTRSWAGATPLR